MGAQEQQQNIQLALANIKEHQEKKNKSIGLIVDTVYYDVYDDYMVITRERDRSPNKVTVYTGDKLALLHKYNDFLYKYEVEDEHLIFISLNPVTLLGRVIELQLVHEKHFNRTVGRTNKIASLLELIE
ncbi:hypothetical protein [Pontibacter litorisediminis]|uniref:hypothetical protein n=1 Tax=Pontibacter litorisediminis TaxID=1846260 RepID=UPI0023EDEACC|nr:hypothetical protein [Pontibacter litorisediminis]